MNKNFRWFLTLSFKNYAIWLIFECARAKTAQKSWDLPFRSCWVAPEISTLHTSTRMEVPLPLPNLNSHVCMAWYDSSQRCICSSSMYVVVRVINWNRLFNGSNLLVWGLTRPTPFSKALFQIETCDLHTFKYVISTLSGCCNICENI